MTVKKIILSLALFAAASSVLANDLMPFSELDNFKSSTTRADVKAAVMRDRAAQTVLAHGDITDADQPAVVVRTTRARQESIESAKAQPAAGKAGI